MRSLITTDSGSPGVGLLRPLAAEEGVLVQGGLEAGEGELLVIQTAGETRHQAQARRGDLRQNYFRIKAFILVK